MPKGLRFWPWFLLAAVAGFLVGTDTGCGVSECATPPSKCVNPGPCPGLITLWVRDGVSKADIERINAEIGATIDPAEDRPPHFQVALPPCWSFLRAYDFYHSKPEIELVTQVHYLVVHTEGLSSQLSHW